MRIRSIAAIGGCAVLISAPAHAEPGLKTGLAGPEFLSGNASVRNHWTTMAAKAKAGFLRLDIPWSSLASSPPANPANPADPAYDFATVDRAVISARARGLRPMLTIFQAPAWATSPSCGQNRSACKPNTKAFGKLGKALARRYSGNFGPLPRVKHFQAWVEPNLSIYLAPQWRRGKHAGPKRYRKMLNAFRRNIKSVKGSNTVISAGLAPFGDSRGGPRSRPVQFWRNVFCLNKRLKRKCKGTARFDVLGHHAINPRGGPGAHARHRDDAAVPDLNRIRRVLRAAERHGTAKGGRHPLWMTEMWWETDPPDGAFGVKPRKQARRIVRTMWEVWRDGARLAINFRIRDERHDPQNPANNLQAGLYFRSGKSKPALRAFRFPFLARKKSGKKVVVWGRTPKKGTLRIQRKKGKRWRTVRKRKLGSGKVFEMKIRSKGKAHWRAKTGSSKSLTSSTR